jgi:hypothetical protein
MGRRKGGTGKQGMRVDIDKKVKELRDASKLKTDKSGAFRLVTHAFSVKPTYGR